MATDNTKILLNVEVITEEAVKHIAELSTKIAELKKDEEELKRKMRDMADKDSEGYKNLANQLAVNTERQKAYRKELTDASRQLQNNVTGNGKYADTLKGLCAQLSKAKDELRAMSINDPKWHEQAEKVKELNNQVKRMEQEYGVYTRNVGNYTNSIVEAFHSAGGGISGIAAGAKVASGTIVAGISGIIAVVGKLLNSFKMPIEFEQANKDLQTILGVTDEEMKRLTLSAKELGRTTEYTASQVTNLQTELAKLGFTIPEITDMQAAVLALATDLNTDLGSAAAMTGATLRSFGADASEASHYIDVLVKGANSSALSFSAYQTALSQVSPVAKAMGFSLEDVVALLGTLVNAGMDASMAATSTRNILLKMADANSDLSKSLGMTANDIPSLVEGLHRLNDAGIDVSEALSLTDKRSVAAFTRFVQGADEVKALRDQLEGLNDYALAEQEERINTTSGAMKILQSAWEGFVLAVGQNTGWMAKAFNGLASAISGITDKIDPEGKFQREQNARVQQFVKSYKAIAEAAKKNGADVFKTLESQYLHDTDAYEAQMQELNDKYNATTKKREKERIKEEYRVIWNLNNAAKEGYEKALDILRNSNEKEKQELEMQQKTKAQITEKGTKAAENAAEKAADTALKSTQKMIKSYATLINEISDTLTTDETERAINNTKKKYNELAVSIRDAVKSGTMSFEEANYYRVALAQQEAAEIKDIETKAAEETAAEEERIRLESEAKQLEATEKRLAKQKELNEEYLQDTLSTMGSLNDTLNNLDDRRLAKYEASNEAQKEALEKRLDAGLISEEAYDDAVAELDAELDAKKAEIAQKEAMRERALSVFEIAINTAKAVMKIWAEVPKADFGVQTSILTALAIAAGAAQSAAVLSEPIPTARRGGLVQGATHEQGGVLINTENDERIIGSDPSKAFPELLNLISYIGKNIPNSGYADRQSITNVTNTATYGSVDYAAIKAAMTEALQGLKIYTAITDIHDAERQMAKIEATAKM